MRDVKDVFRKAVPPPGLNPRALSGTLKKLVQVTAWDAGDLSGTMDRFVAATQQFPEFVPAVIMLKDQCFQHRSTQKRAQFVAETLQPAGADDFDSKSAGRCFYSFALQKRAASLFEEALS